MERWGGGIRRELLDRLVIVNAAHLRKVLAEYEDHFNAHRPHRALTQARPLRPLPDPIDAENQGHQARSPRRAATRILLGRIGWPNFRYPHARKG
jgi:hypothetical protein